MKDIIGIFLIVIAALLLGGHEEKEFTVVTGGILIAACLGAIFCFAWPDFGPSESDRAVNRVKRFGKGKYEYTPVRYRDWD